MIPGPTELILILLIVVMLFGAKKIPEIMSGLGKGIKTFKKAMEEEDDSEIRPPSPTEPPPAPTTSQQGSDSASVSKEKIEPK
ncbi:MAG: twin-arginine translocase TatA/TatE family subunit [Desulfomonilaceae bacterium]